MILVTCVVSFRNCQNKSETRTTEDPKDKFFQVGAVVPVTQAGAVHAAYGQVKTGDLKDSKFSLAYHHSLSKRTSLYSTVAYINNKNAAAYVVDSKPALASSQ